MYGTAELYSAIEESARLVDVTCSRDKVWPVITAYEEVLAQAAIAFRVATGARHAGELDCRFLSLPNDCDPYAVALSAGLTTKPDHPAGALLADIHEQCPIGKYGVDFGVVGGFKKTWSFFPPDGRQELAKLAGIPSMPRSLGDNAGFFARHGMADTASIIGIDYPHRTVNVYFGEPAAATLEAKAVVSMHRELGLPEPSEQMLAVIPKAYGIYFTLSWDSPKIERIAFPIIAPDPLALPVRLDPMIEQFVKNVPCHAADHVVFYAATSPAGEYYKVHSYYQWQPPMYVTYENRD